MQQTVSVWRIVRTDPAVLMGCVYSLLGLAGALLLWGSYATGWAVMTQPDRVPPSLIKVLLGAAAFGAPVVIPTIWWVGVTRRVLAEGVSAHAIVRKIGHAYGGIRVEFESANDGRASGTAVCSDNRRVRRLDVGTEVTVCYDPRQPRHQFVAELYVDAIQQLEAANLPGLKPKWALPGDRFNSVWHGIVLVPIGAVACVLGGQALSVGSVRYADKSGVARVLTGSYAHFYGWCISIAGLVLLAAGIAVVIRESKATQK